MIRWKYLLPRMGLLCLVLLIIWVGSRPLLKFALIQSGQSITGAKVEIDTVHFSILDGRVELNDVAMADPRKPMKNLLQAKNMVINIDPRRLLHREFIVEEATLDNIQFGTPRTESGRLAVETPQKQPEEAYLVRVINDRLQQLGGTWLDQISERFPAVLENEFQTVRVANDLKEKWPAEYQRLRGRAEDIQRRVRQLKSVTESLTKNPLRDIERYQQLINDIALLRKQIEETRSQVHRLGDEFAQDRQRLTLAKNHDQQSLGQKMQSGELVDQHLISQVLLGDLTADRLQEILAWVHWFRDTVPDPEKDFYPTRARGYDVQFRQRPNLVFKKLHLSGQGRLAGRNFEFFGEALDVSTNPKLYDKPTRIKLRGSAGTVIVVDAILDRRGSQKIDSFRISCPELVVPATTLGNESDIQVALGRCKLVVDINIKLVDNRIAGTMEFRQQGVSLNVNHLSESIGGQQTCQIINQNLASLNEFVVSVDLSGELSAPKMRLSSDLGPKFAASIDGAARQMVSRLIEQQSEKLDRLVENQVNDLNQEFSINVNEILAILNTENPIVSQLERMVPKNLELWPKIRR